MCACKEAPWHVVPADQKWFGNLAVSEAIVNSVRPYQAGWLERLEEIDHWRGAPNLFPGFVP